MQKRSIIVFMALALFAVVVAACQGPPPTMYVLVVTATPEATIEPERSASEVPADTAETDNTETSPTATVAPATATSTPEPTTTATEIAPETTEEIDPSAMKPTATFTQIQVAEQLFQNGRMFWLEPTNQIWVLAETDDGIGVWTVFEDLFEEGDLEFDPDLVPPEGLLQPIRGFGRVWRENQDVRDALGWATEPEIGHVSNYEFQPEGEIVDGEFQPAPGYHFLLSFYGERIRFNEINGTWQIAPSSR